MKPDNPEVVAVLEKFALSVYEEDATRFTFVYPDKPAKYFSYTTFVDGAPKTLIVRSRRVFPDAWAAADAIALSYRGKKSYRVNVVLKGQPQAYSLDVSLKTGKLTWREIDTQLATQLKEALEVATR